MTDEPEDFAALFEASIKAKQIREGQPVDGTIVAIGAEVAFVDVGGKGEATIDVNELKDENGRVDVAVGDRIRGLIVSTSGGLRLSRRLARNAATDSQIEDAFRAGLPVEGRVEKANKGGYDVRVGHQRAFCPISQIDLARTEDPSVHVGKVYQFRIVEYKEGGRNLVVSRRALLEQEQHEKADAVRKSIVTGAILPGRVASVRDFGAFVDLGGGVQGLLHISEMAWSRADDASQLVKPGDEVVVKVQRIESDKISLSVKELIADPWAAVPQKYHVGDVVVGRVTRTAEFGAFVELEPGVEALAHASTFVPPNSGTDRWSGLVTIGMNAPFEILTIDTERRRIGVSLVPEGTSLADADVSQHVDAGPPDGFGSLADKLRNALERKR